MNVAKASELFFSGPRFISLAFYIHRKEYFDICIINIGRYLAYLLYANNLALPRRDWIASLKTLAQTVHV